jgi:glutathione synthase/RimK-type ligase-like ATP-grasp enzyme
LSGSAPGAPGARRRLAAASNASFPNLHDDWPLLRAALADAGVEAVTAVWNDPAVDWSAFDLVLASGTWDNIHHVDEFLAWADTVAASGVPVRNSPATLRWNIDKTYLVALERAGIPTVPTIWVEPGTSDVEVASLALPEGEVVVKPSVSGGGYRTARYEPHEEEAARAHVVELIASGRTAMVQPYQPRVDAEGETGLIYIGGTFSHAIRKDPMIRRGVGPLDHLMDNQVISGATATTAQRRVAARSLAAAEELLGPTSYARVDVVETPDAGPALLELELLDPVLFLTHHPEGAVTLARELAGLLERR